MGIPKKQSIGGPESAPGLAPKPPKPQLTLPYSDEIASEADVFTLRNTLGEGQSEADTSRLSTIVGGSVIAHGVHGVNGAGAAAGAPQAGTGVWGESDNGFGVFGASTKGDAGHFEGNVTINGTLTHNGNCSLNGILTVLNDVVLLSAGQDCAEQFELSEAKQLEPGTVVVIDRDGALRESHAAYDKKVAGVVSGAGPSRPGIVLGKHPSEPQSATVALVGRVYCKVDAQYSSIQVGDLLTTSTTPGHAMRADDPQKAFGAVIGKALRPLWSGQGLIPILIALQ